VDNVTIVDAVRITADQPLHESNSLAFVMQFDDVGV
jgi:hypothetical protein